MSEFGKILVGIGAFIVVAGLLLWALGRAGFRGLPGDIKYEGEHVRVYFPIVTCIVLSILGTLAIWAWRWMSGRR